MQATEPGVHVHLSAQVQNGGATPTQQRSREVAELQAMSLQTTPFGEV